MAATRYFIANANGFFINWSSDLEGIETYGQTISAFGGVGSDAVYVGAGTKADLTGITSTGGSDVVYLTGNFADYSQSNAGATYTLTRDVVLGGETFTESVTFIASNGDSVSFADGSIAIGFSDLPGFLPLTSSALDTTATTPLDPLDSSIPAITGNAATRVFISDATGENVSAGIRGSALTLAGGVGDDTVHVGVGTTVDATELTSTGGNDSVYLQGAFAEYSQSNIGPTYTLTRDVVIGGTTFTESVIFIASNGDRVYFADGFIPIGFSDLPEFPALTSALLDTSDATPSLTYSVTSVVINGAESDSTATTATLVEGDQVVVSVTLSENTTVTGTPEFTISVGGLSRQAVYQSGSGTRTLLFTYTVNVGEEGAVTAAADALTLSGGTLLNAESVAPLLATPAIPESASNVAVDTSAPSISSSVISGADASGAASSATLDIGDSVLITLTFSEIVSVGGVTPSSTPQYTFLVGEFARQANYVSGTGSNTLIFSYTVAEGDLDREGGLTAAGTTALNLNGASLADLAGNIPSLVGPSITFGDNAVVVDTVNVELGAIQSVTNTEGFVINGFNTADISGFSVSDAGDVNGDGLADVIVSAHLSDINGMDSGASYVVFGQTGGGAVELSDIEAGNGGFAIHGVSAEDAAGRNVSGAGDVNGDGLADLIVGANLDDPNGTNSGASFVVFGKTDSGVVELSAIEQGSNTGGFVINGVSPDDFSGGVVHGAGDVNGDGLADVIVGVNRDDPNGDNSGASFVVFGKADGLVVELSDVEAGTGGFVINGVSDGDRSGYSVSAAGDVNGDGLSDLIVGAFADDPRGGDSGASFVVFGKTDSGAVELSDIEAGTGGFAIHGVSDGDRSGISVSSAGDVNGDGLADLIIGADLDDPNGENSGASFVVFGKTGGEDVELSAIEQGTNAGGFVINGVGAIDLSGRSVSSAGDVNGDGLADLIVGAHQDDPNGGNSGASFVVYGKTDGSVIELSEIETGTGGFAIFGSRVGDRSGRSVSSAGDVNGDGFDDLLVGAYRDDANGVTDSGTSFVIFGGQGTSATVGSAEADTLSGDTSANQLVGGRGADTLIGGGGADVLRGGEGNDVLAISDATFASLDGGLGTDTLRFDSILTIDFTVLSDLSIEKVEVIDLLTSDGGASTITLNLTDVLNFADAGAQNTLTIQGAAGDSVNLSNASNGEAGTWVQSDSGATETYSFTSVVGGAVLARVVIDDAVTTTVI